MARTVGSFLELVLARTCSVRCNNARVSVCDYPPTTGVGICKYTLYVMPRIHHTLCTAVIIKSNQITLFQASWPIANRQTDTHKQLDNKHPHTHTHTHTRAREHTEHKTLNNKNICTSITHWHSLGQSTIQFN